MAWTMPSCDRSVYKACPRTTDCSRTVCCHVVCRLRGRGASFQRPVRGHIPALRSSCGDRLTGDVGWLWLSVASSAGPPPPAARSHGQRRVIGDALVRPRRGERERDLSRSAAPCLKHYTGE